VAPARRSNVASRAAAPDNRMVPGRANGSSSSLPQRLLANRKGDVTIHAHSMHGRIELRHDGERRERIELLLHRPTNW
jgi:hypothetical protein